MRAVVIHAPGDVRVEDVEKPTIAQPTDAIIEVKAACVCGSDLWPYRGAEDVDSGAQMGHEYVGVVSEIGDDVRDVQPGDWVVGSFVASCGTCEICEAGYESGCKDRVFMGSVGTQADFARIPHADGTLVKLPSPPTDEQLRHVLAASDVLGTGWFGAVAAEVGPGKTVAVVGDGAVGLSAVLAAKQLGAKRIIVSSRHPQRQNLARQFGATDILEERGEVFAEKVREMTEGYGAHCAVEAVGTDEAMQQAMKSTRRGGHVGFVGVSHDVTIEGIKMFISMVHLHGGPAPVRRFLPELIDLIYFGAISPGDVFDLTLPLSDAPRGYDAMDKREAIKVMLTP